MEIILNIFIFCLILFIYIHIQFQLKISNDLEIFEIEKPSKDKFEEICDYRQPTIFHFNNKNIVSETNFTTILNKYFAFDMKVRNIQEINQKDELYLPMSVHLVDKLLQKNNESSYYSENNKDLLNETGLIKPFRNNDLFFRPHMVSNCQYDVIVGSNYCYTPFRYELSYRNFFMPTSGKIKVKLSPPKNAKYFYTNYDYENFEFSSPINPWNPQPEYIHEFDKVKCLEFVIDVGKTLYIPPYWWYSFEFIEYSSISILKYKTYMNNVSVLPYFGLHLLQKNNVKRQTNKTINESEQSKMEQKNK